MISVSLYGFQRLIQVRADSFQGDRPDCPRGCPGRLHRHGSYQRFDQPCGDQKRSIQRFICPRCGQTVSVLPADCLTYSPLKVQHLQAYFDSQAEISSGLDPPPDLKTAACMRRAWKRFLTRVQFIKNAFGQILPAVTSTPQHLWKQLRREVGTAERMLAFLAQHGKQSLLGDYACLQLAP